MGRCIRPGRDRSRRARSLTLDSRSRCGGFLGRSRSTTLGGIRHRQEIGGLLHRRKALSQGAASLLGGEAHRDEAAHRRRLSGDSSVLARGRSRSTTLGGIGRCRPAIPIWNRRHHGRTRLPTRRYLRPRARWERSAESYLLPPVPGIAAQAGQRASRYCAACHNRSIHNTRFICFRSAPRSQPMPCHAVELPRCLKGGADWGAK